MPMYRTNSGQRIGMPYEAFDDAAALQIAEELFSRQNARNWLQKLARNGGWNWIIPSIPPKKTNDR